MQSSECQKGAVSTPYEINEMKAQSHQRLSPDITCLAYCHNEGICRSQQQQPNKSENYSSEGENFVAKEEEENKDHNMNHQQHQTFHLNPIAEVPYGFYEYFVGDNGELRILCKVCHYVSNKKSNFKRHFTNMHFVHDDDKLLECCGIRFSTKGEKFYHTKSVHKTGYKCTICFKVFDRPALLQRHLAKHTGKKPYKCSLCSYQTPNKANAKRHIEKRHSDVPEGSILFVTEDGEQIQMEVVTKTEKDSASGQEISSPGSSSSASIPISSVTKSRADSSTPYSFFDDLIGPVPTFKYPHPPSATVTSSSAFASPGSYAGSDLCDEYDEKRPPINHSIDNIMNRVGVQNFGYKPPVQYASTPAGFLEGNQFSQQNNQNPENPAATTLPSSSFTPLIGYNQQPVNERLMRSLSSSNWSQVSSPLPLHNYTGGRNPQPQPLNLSTSGATLNSIPSSAPALLQNQNLHHRPFPIVFRQCPHGCWHQWNHFPDNQITSDFMYSRASFVTPFTNSSPDLRSSSSFSQQTENSSINSFQETPEHGQEDDDSDVIDVVGTNSEDDDGASTSKNLKYLCEGLGSCSTTEIHSHHHHRPQVKQEGQPENKADKSAPPVVSPLIPDRMNNEINDVVDGEGGNNNPNVDESLRDGEDQYIPKKLRMSKSFLSKTHKF